MRKNILKIGIIYLIGQFLIKGIAFLLIPIYSRYLGSEIYGELAIVDIFCNIFSNICIFSIYSGHTRFYSEDREYKGFASIFYFSIACIIFYGVLIFSFGQYFAVNFLKIQNAFVILILIFIRGSIEQLIALLDTRYGMEYCAKKLVIIRFVQTLCSLLFIIYFVVFKGQTIIGIYLGWILGQIPILVYLIFDNKGRIGLKLDKILFKKMFLFSLGLILGNLSYLIISMIDRFFLREYRTFSDVGIYAMGYKFGALIDIFFIYSFKKIFIPFKFTEYDKPNFIEKLNKYYYLYSLLGSLVFLLASINIKIILSLFTTSEFIMAYTITPLIIISYLLYGYTEFYNVGVNLKNKSYITSFIIFCGGFLNTVTNIYLVKKYGMYGAGISTLLAYIFMNITFYICSQKLYPIKYEIKESLKVILISLFAYSVYFYISCRNLNIITEGILGNSIFVFYCIVIYKWFLSRELQSYILGNIKKINTNIENILKTLRLLK